MKTPCPNCTPEKNSANPCHTANLPRLNRISGQLEGVKKMIEEGRYCPDILIQLKAIRSAIRAVESNILSVHLQHCVSQSFSSEEEREQKIEELKTLFDRFEE
ncbi:MAG: metal-sensitive transcriptional regulator [Pseudomonadota bacterium]|nr:metal-sensitive transcriptional regulator [Pseudomonadota bacterium]